MERNVGVFLEKAVPENARDAYRRDAWGGMLAGLFNGAIGPFLGFIARHELHAGNSLIGLMSAAPAVGSIFALLYANSMEGRKKMPYVVWPGVIGRGLFLFTLFATTPFLFAIIVFASLGLASIIGPGYAAILKEIYPNRHRGQIMGYIRVGMAFMTFAATLIVGQLLNGCKINCLGLTIDPVNYRYIFPFAGLIGVASSIAFSSIKTAPVDETHPSNQRVPITRFLSDTLGILKDDEGYKWFCIAIFMSGFGNLIVVPFFPIFQVDTLHITAGWVAILVNITTVVWMLSYLYWGKHVDARCPLTATMITVLINAMVPLCYYFASSVWMLIPASLLTGIMMGGMELAYFNSILLFAEDGKESRYQALHSFLFGLRGTIAPFVGVALVKAGMDIRTLFLLGTFMMLIGAGLQLKGIKKMNR
ncbi:MAG: MFS transporter [Armatimonadota bacterium]